MADIIVEKIFNAQIFSWGAKDLVNQGDQRKRYIDAIRDADKGDYKPLLKFARS